MNLTKSSLLLVLGALAMLFTSCSDDLNLGGLGSAQGSATGSGSTDTTGFLVTEYEPLTRWFDERFDVDYKHMPPDLIFDQVPLNGIKYEVSKLPTNATPFNYSNSDISRRELLKRIADHWNLQMSLSLDPAGNPAAVRVEG